MDFQPTTEQQAALAAFKTGEHVVLEAGAGAGKTSTLKLLARSDFRRKGIYFAFNKSTAVDAARSFPETVTCKTLHGFAYAAMMTPERRARLGSSQRVRSAEAARILGLRGPARFSADLAPLSPQQLASLAIATVTRFCQSSNETITARHVPTPPGMEDPRVRDALASIVVPAAARAWGDITSPGGRLRFTHDHYLKMWALTHPSLEADYVFLDEAQDSNGLTVGVVADQIKAGAQVITVGDRNQAIYGWRGATDAMDAFGGQHLSLTQSFRFGPAIANEANKWLTALHSQLRITGTTSLLSVLDDLDGPTPTGERAPDAILCRSNAGALEVLMDLLERGIKASIVGGADDMARLAQAAIELTERGQTFHPELIAFTSWRQVQDYVEQDADGSDLAVAVRLIDAHTPEVILSTVDAMSPERGASLLLSTAHKAKGREWNRVRIGKDFRAPKPDENGDVRVRPDEAMLAYVAVTRAQKVLDRGSLDWIDGYLAKQRVAA